MLVDDIGDVTITNDLTVLGHTTLTDVGITGLLELTGDYTYTQTGTTQRIGNTDITGSLTVNGHNTVQFEDIKFFSNDITTTILDSDLTLGTITVLGPFETTKVTLVPLATGELPSGDCEIT